MRKGKKDKKKVKMALIISIIVSIISFFGVGVTAPPTPNNTHQNNIILDENQNNTDINENVIEESNKTEDNENITEESNNNPKEEAKNELENKKNEELSNLQSYTNNPYIVINNNIPFFYDTELTTQSYEIYSELDSQGRCGVAISCIGKDIMPTEERGNIGSVKPTGWHTVKYDGIDGNYLYNRCHLIGYQLTAENANEKNLITGTRYMNVEGMLPFENMVADYINETNNHVLYRVTPIFEENNLLASGVLMEAKSVEDNGKGIQFNVYCYNVQPGIEIDYATGESSGPEYKGSTSSNETTNKNESNEAINTDSSNENTGSNLNTTDGANKNTSSSTITSTEENNSKSKTYILNNNTKKYHEPGCRYVSSIKDKNKGTYTGSSADLDAKGYEACKVCRP